jgi:hypothetical protein
MTDQLEPVAVVGFPWRKPANGDAYELADTEVMVIADRGSKMRSEIVQVIREKREERFDIYRPLVEETGLFGMFAAIDPTPESFLTFANRFGPLFDRDHAFKNRGGSGQKLNHMPHTRDDDRTRFDRFEHVQDWQIVHSHLRHFLDLFEAIRTGDPEKLAHPIPKWGGVLDPSNVPDSLADFEKTIPQRQLQKYLHGRTSPQQRAAKLAEMVCGGAVGAVVRNRVRFEIAWNSSEQRFDAQLQPQDLVGAMYYQFSTAITEGRRFQRCHACGRWFMLLPGVNRANKLTCSQSCRTHACRQRQERASVLKAQGMRVPAIAKALGSDVETVKRWLAKAEVAIK